MLGSDNVCSDSELLLRVWYLFLFTSSYLTTPNLWTIWTLLSCNVLHNAHTISIIYIRHRLNFHITRITRYYVTFNSLPALLNNTPQLLPITPNPLWVLLQFLHLVMVDLFIDQRLDFLRNESIAQYAGDWQYKYQIFKFEVVVVHLAKLSVSNNPVRQILYRYRHIGSST